MTRRAAQRPSLSLILGGLLLLTALVATALLIFRGDHNPYRTLPSLSLSAYLDNANSLRGNVYRLEGVIHNSLAWSPAKGRLISLDLPEEGGIVAIFIPAALNHINLQKGQRFLLKIEIVQGGLIQVLEMTKA